MKAYKTTIHTDGDTVNVVHHSTKIIEHDLVENPDFCNLDVLTEQIERKTLKFISDVEKFLSK